MNGTRTPEDVFDFSENMEELLDLEKKILAAADTKKIVNSHREQAKILEELDGVIEDISNVYDPAVHDREPLEEVFATKIDILYGMARRFHPLSEYGIETMKRAVACRQDFEELAGPFITRITQDNIERFDDLLPDDLIEDIIVGKLQALGAIRSQGSELFGVGAIVFDIDSVGETEQDAQEVLRVSWLYVDEDWRERGIANSLVGELVCFMAETGTPAMTVDFYVDDDAELYGNLFSEWHFLFAAGVTPELAFTLSDISEQSTFEKYEDKATSLMELADREEKLLVRDFLLGNEYQGYLNRETLPEDYIETELSSYTGSKTRPDGLLLAHRYPSGKISIEYNGSRGVGDDRTEEMLGALAYTAALKYDRSTEVVMNERYVEDGELLDELFRRQKGQYMIEGILTPPFETIGAADVARFIKESTED